LHAVVRSSQDDIVRLLKSFGAKSVSDKFGRTPAFYSIENGCENITNILINGGDTRDFLLHHAVRKGCSEEVINLLQEGADVNFKDELGRTPLHWICYPYDCFQRQLGQNS